MSLHENIHLLAARGTSHGMGYEAFQRGGVQVLEEGVTEAYKVRVLNAYIAELGLERIAPMISKAEPFTAYPQFVPAAEVFANAIARRTQVDEKRELSRPSGPDGQGEPGPRGALDGQEVLRRLAVVNAEDKFRVAVELVYEASDLPELVPKSHRDQAIERIMGSMMQPFDRIEDFAADDVSDIAMSPLAGSEADRKGHQQVRVLTRFWSTRQDLRKSLDLGITGSPRLTAPARPGSATAQGQDSGGVPPTGGRRLSRRDQINCRPVERND